MTPALQEALAQQLLRLVDALLRHDTEQDGNWGWPSTRQELTSIRYALLAQTDAAPQPSTAEQLAGPSQEGLGQGDAAAAARYRWLNKQHNFMIYIEGNDQMRTNVRLRCGEPLDTWIDARIREESAAPQDKDEKHTG